MWRGDVGNCFCCWVDLFELGDGDAGCTAAECGGDGVGVGVASGSASVFPLVVSSWSLISVSSIDFRVSFALVDDDG